MSVSPAFVVALPLVGAGVLIALLDRIPRRVTECLGIAIALATLGGTVALLLEVSHAGPIVQWIGGWHPGNRVGLGVVLAVDVASACVAISIATVVLATTVFCIQYFEKVGTIFYVLLLAMLGAMIAFAYAGDLFNLFVWYEVFSVAAYALATYHGESDNAYKGALQFALTNTVAGLFFLVGIILLEGRTGELDLVAIGHSLASRGPGDALVTTALAFIAIGLFTRGAIAPLQFWFDEVHGAAPAPLSAILSGAMVPLALYGFVRIYWSAFERVLPPSHAIVAVLSAFGALTAVYGTAMTLRESRLKRKLAQATVAHSGVGLAAVATFGTHGLAGAGLYEASYAIAAAALFFVFSILKSTTGEHDVKMLRGAGRRLPLTGAVFALGVAMMAGVWAGARSIADTGTGASGAGVGILAAIVAIGTGGAFLAAFVRIFFFSPRGVRVRRRDDVPWFLIGPALALAALATAIATIPLAADIAARGATALAAHGAYARAVMDGDRGATPGFVLRTPLQSLAWPILACVAALAILTRNPLVRGARIAAMKNVAYRIFATLDRGDCGSYIAWIAGTAAALGFALSFAIP